MYPLILPAASAGQTNANGLLPSQHWLKQQHPGPSLNQMQRINYENLSQAPSALRWSGLPPTPCRENLQPPGGSWEMRLAGDARANSKSRNVWDQATQMKLRMSHIMDTETEPQVGPPLGQLVPALECQLLVLCALYLFFKQ